MPARVVHALCKSLRIFCALSVGSCIVCFAPSKSQPRTSLLGAHAPLASSFFKEMARPRLLCVMSGPRKIIFDGVEKVLGYCLQAFVVVSLCNCNEVINVHFNQGFD